MDPKDKKEELLEPEKISQEPQFDFEDAKDLTVGQVIRKNEEIEADKFTNIQAKKEELRSLDDLLQDAKETIDEEVEPVEEVPDLEIVAEEEGVAMEEFLLPPLEETLVMDKNLVEPVTEPLVAEDEEALQEEHQSLSRSAQAEDEPQNKKLWVILSALLAIIVLIIGGSYYVYRQITRSSQEIQSQSSDTGLVSNQAILNQFNSLYDTFYTDENKTALKNSQFSQLSQLKELLDKLEGASEHTLAKSKYDSLETQIKAVQDVNAQFETPAITDGVLNTNAKVKADAKFTEVKTGNTEIDKLLAKAISLGKSQLSSSTSSSSSQSSSATESNASSSANASTSAGETASASNILNSGLASNGVNLQRSVSRVPYNQAAVSDSSDPAWTFADGVLERILETSRARGYITGNQYILEPVNIVNGNGYYNLYKPDGTYLFTLNCKTGYFVGNGSGHADDLDY